MDVLGAETVFVAVLEEPVACVNHEDTRAMCGVFLVNHQNTGGDTGPHRTDWQVNR